MAIPCSRTIPALLLAELYLERVVGTMGLPNEIFSDHDHLFTADLFMTLCDLSGVQQKQSPIYRARSNGRAERAVQVVLDILRTFLAQTGKQDPARILPLALRTINDVPGPVSGYSPDLFVFGRQPIGFSDCPPVIPEHGSEDPVSFFKRLIEDHKYVHKKLQDIHDKASRICLQQHPPYVYQDGERVRYQNHKKNSNRNRLHRLWKGPSGVLGRLSTDQYLVATDKGEMILDGNSIQPYIPSSLNEKTPLHYYTDQEFLIETDTYILEHIREHHRVGKGKNRRIEWDVKYRGFPNYEWQPASFFMNNVTDVWLKYNNKHNINVSVKDLRILVSQKCCPCMAQSCYDSLCAEERREWKELKCLEKVSRPRQPPPPLLVLRVLL